MEEEEEEGRGVRRSLRSAAERRQDGGPPGPGGEDGPAAPEPPRSSPLSPRSTTLSSTLSSTPSTTRSTPSTTRSTPLHRRHMPTDTLRFHIPRKKETTALFQYVSSESREFEDMLTTLTSSYKDETSSQSFTYSQPRLVHSAGLETQFVEKRKEMKSEGRTELELKESHCFLLADPVKLPVICEKGLLTGHSWVTALGTPSKGVYLSKFSDLLQNTPLSPGSSGDILIFKVLKGRVKSIYESTSKSLLDPTPRYDSHVSKNASKVTSLTTYRAFELTQQYFYEYWFDEVRTHPRQVRPYAVVSYLFTGKDAPPPNKPLPLPRLNSQSANGSKERAQFVVWSGALVREEQHLLHVSLLSLSPPLLPCSLPDKLEIDWLMSLTQVTKLLPSSLFCWNLYTGSHEVVKSGWFCRLLEVSERRDSAPDASRFLLQLEDRKLVLVCPLPHRGFLFLLSSVQMAPPTERSALWKRCLQALFVFPESRDMARPMSQGSLSTHEATGQGPGGPGYSVLGWFTPALHQALVKARANPPSELSAGVERQMALYLAGRRDRTVRPYSVPVYDPKLDERGKLFPAPKHHRLNMDGYLRSYLYSPAFYKLSLGHAHRLLELHPPPDEDEPEGSEPLAEPGAELVTEKAVPVKDPVMKSSILRDPRTAGGEEEEEKKKKEEEQHQQQEEEEEVLQRRKRSLEEPAEPSAKRCKTQSGALLTNEGLNQHSGSANQRGAEEEAVACDRLAARLAPPSKHDVDPRKHQELEEQTGGSVSSVEGFSPVSLSGELTPRGGGGGGDEEHHEIPWLLIPITGVPCVKYSQRQTDTPLDPRVSHTARGPSPEPSPAPPPPSGALATCPANELQTAAVKVQLPDSAPREPAGNPGGGQNVEPRPLQEEATPTPATHSSPLHKEEVERGEKLEEGELLDNEKEVMMEALEPEGEEEEEREALGGVSPAPPLLGAVASITKEHLGGVSPAPPLLGAVASITKEHLGGVSPAPPLLGGVASIMKEHLGDFSSDVQHLLQEENVTRGSLQHTVPTRPTQRGPSAGHAPSLGHAPSVGHHPTIGHAPSTGHAPCPDSRRLQRFSQYVSFFSCSAPVHDFVSSLRQDMSSLLLDSLATASLATASLATPGLATTSLATPGLATPSLANPGLANASLATASLATASLANPGLANASLANASLATPSLANASLANTSSTETNVTLASNISDFLAGVRASASDHSGSSESFGQNLKEVESGPSKGRGLGCPLLQPPAPPSPPAPTQLAWLPRQPPGLLGNSSGTSRSSTADTGSLPDPYPGRDLEAEPGPVPPPAALSTLISQLQPEVFSSLVEIIKDVKRNSLQFYVHSCEPEDLLYDHFREYLLSQGHVEQSPVTFLEQESPAERLLIVIQNKDISAHIHKVPGLVSLKRRSCVQFVGVDSLDDLRSSSFHELFVSGGCVVSDEFVLNPHFITHERLEALLMFLEDQSSAEGVWRWKIHCKTYKTLRQQARFKRDAASLLDVLSAYQKRLMVELLPYHHCDITNSQSPDLDCLIQLQARYTQHRHLIFLTERRFEMFPKYSSSGIIIANIDDIIHSFGSLVGDHGNKDQPITGLAPQGVGPGVGPGVLGRQPSQEDPALGCELSPFSSSPPVLPLPCSHFLPPSSPPSLPAPPPPLLDQLVPDFRTPRSSSSSCSSSNEGLPPQSSADFEALRFAISHLKAERQARLGGAPLGGAPEEPQPAPGGGASAATLDSVHSVLESDGGGAPEPGGGDALVQSQSGEKAESSAVATDDASDPVEIDGEVGEGACPGLLVDDAPTCSPTPPPVGGSAPRQQGRPEAPEISKRQDFIKTQCSAHPGSAQPSQDHIGPANPGPAHSGSVQPSQDHIGPAHPGPARMALPPHYQRLPAPQYPSSILPRPPAMRFPHSPLLGPLAALGGLGLLGPGAVWPGGLLWFQQGGRDMRSLMGNFPNPGPPIQFRPGPRGDQLRPGPGRGR